MSKAVLKKNTSLLEVTEYDGGFSYAVLDNDEGKVYELRLTNKDYNEEKKEYYPSAEAEERFKKAIEDIFKGMTIEEGMPVEFWVLDNRASWRKPLEISTFPANDVGKLLKVKIENAYQQSNGLRIILSHKGKFYEIRKRYTSYHAGKFYSNPQLETRAKAWLREYFNVTPETIATIIGSEIQVEVRKNKLAKPTDEKQTFIEVKKS